MKLWLAQQELLNKAKQAAGGGTDLQSGNIGDIAKRGINLFLLVIGAVAVIMVIIGGLRYVFSGGDSKATQDAKNTVLYALIGLAVALSAGAIVNFVIGKF